MKEVIKKHFKEPLYEGCKNTRNLGICHARDSIDPLEHI